MEGGLLACLRSQPLTDAGCFLYQEEHLVSCGVFGLISEVHHAKHGPCLKMGGGFVPTHDRGEPLLPHQQTCVRY